MFSIASGFPVHLEVCPFGKTAFARDNPRAGIKKANRYLPDLLRLFSDYGYVTTAYMTGKRGDGAEFTRLHAGGADLVVSIGGDGTLNEVIDGLLKSGAGCPIGYIPAGSTNDFASSLKISSNIMQAARDIMEGRLRTIDLGSFNGRCFSYVASFGAFTEAAYSTPQEVKNMLANLKVGDRITTIGGIYGTISAIKDDVITIDVGADKTKMIIARWAVRSLENTPAESQNDLI